MDSVLGLDLILERWARCCLLDEMNRVVGLRSGGVPPRFYFGRSAEGCVWRFRADLPGHVVAGIAKLAGRERGWCRDPDDEATPPRPPERLAMMAKLLGDGDMPIESIREPILRDGRLRAEIWYLG